MLISAMMLFGQEIEVDRITFMDPEEIQEICVLEPLEYDANFRFNPAPNRFKADASDGGATFDINFLNNCDGRVWPNEAREAFEYAAELWGNHLSSPVPIKVNATWRSLGSNTLGSAGPSTFFTLTGSGVFSDTWYPIAQASALVGTDLKEGRNINSDININISCDRQDWYFGTDANTPSGLYDLVTVLIHEIGHGIGFLGSVFGNNDTQTANWGFPASTGQPSPSNPALPVIYDQFALAGDFTRLIDTDVYENPSAALYRAVTGRVENGVFSGGLEAELALGNLRVPLWAPNLYQSGSSYSHLDQNFFSTTGQFGNNALMRPQIPTAFAIHSPGPVFCGLLQDMNWPLGPACELLIEDTGPIERPLLAIPGNGSSGQTVNPQLVWNDVAGATGYQVQISTNFSHTNQVFDETVSGTSVSVSDPLNESTLYFWRVRALSSSGTSNWSGTFRFSTQLGLPDRVTLSSPEDGATNARPGFVLLWQSVAGSENYQLQVAETPEFSDPVINVTQSNNQYSNTHELEFSTTYYWRVRASNSLGETDWSEVWAFTMIIERPEAVTGVISPAENQIQIPLLTDFNWEPSARASEYNIQISRDKDFSTLPITGTVTTSQFSNTEPLIPAQIYYWRIRASNVGGISNWSEPFTFISVVDETKINHNYPNPFNSVTNLRYQLSNQTHVLIDMYDMTGRRVAVLVNEMQSPGVYIEPLHAHPYASGTYLLRFAADGIMDVQKMTLIK